MAAMPYILAMEFIPFAILSLGLVPAGMPPAKEDPVMARVAPEECLWYLSWAGRAEPDPNSTNQVEQLLAEEQVRQLDETSKQMVEGLLRGLVGSSPRAEAIQQNLPGVIQTALSRPAAIFVSSVHPDGTIEGGAIVNVGKSVKQLEDTLKALQSVLLPNWGGNQGPNTNTAWHTVDVDGRMPVQWGRRDEYLILGAGEGMADRIDKARKGKPPKWMTDLRKNLAVPRTSQVLYINVKGWLQWATENFRKRDEREVLAAAQSLGASQIQYFARVSGLDEKAIISRNVFGIEGEPEGILKLLAAKPLEATDLQPIPADATIAAAVRLDPTKLYAEFLSAAAQFDPRLQQSWSHDISRMEQEWGFSLGDDLCAGLGDTWCLYNSPRQSGLVASGLTLVVPIRDRDRLSRVNEAIARVLNYKGSYFVRRGGSRTFVLQDLAARDPKQADDQGISYKVLEYHGHKIHTVVERELPIMLSWCLSKDALVVSLYPQMIKSYLDSRHRGNDTFAALADIKERLKQKPVLLTHIDTRALFQAVYPIALAWLQIESDDFRRKGLKVDASILPAAPTILPHLVPSGMSMQRTKLGIEMTARRSLPPSSGLLLMAASRMGFVRLLGPAPSGNGKPAVVDGSDITRRLANTENNLKEIGLALHMYHQAHQHLPPAFSTDGDGKPLLSWRVEMLKYIDPAVYSSFRLDEPWDSAHNVQFVARMPPVYQSAGSRVAAEGKTCYVAVRSQDSVLSGSKRIALRDILDGTSKTVAVLQCGDGAAVVWTKPDDYKYDAKRPLAGLGRDKEGNFSALFMDASVRKLSTKADAKDIAALFTRAGREVVDPETAVAK